MNRFTWSIKGRVRWLPVALQDARVNRRWVTKGRRFLVVRHAARQPYFYGGFLKWVGATFPDLRRLFELRLLPCRVQDGDEYVLHIPWLQDPLGDWSPRAYKQAVKLTADCDRLGIPVVNRVCHHGHATKMEGARRIAQAGLRTPRMTPIVDRLGFQATLSGLEPPLIVRENRGHGGRVYAVKTMADAAKIPLNCFRAPIAIEFIDVQDGQDRMYRRYRYVVVGDMGISQGLHVSSNWEARGANRLANEATMREELAYTSATNPHHAQFVHARRLLELDIVAFDYSYDLDGRIVVWEANPYPHWPSSVRFECQHRLLMSERIYATKLLYYLQRAGYEVPADLREFVAGDLAVISRAA
jgi:hypothetical protein